MLDVGAPRSRRGRMLKSRAVPLAKEKPLPAQLGEIIGGYELVRVLSHGGMGCVYHAVHAKLKRPAAVKVLATALLLDEELVARFFREARIVNEVRHPNIVDIFDFVELTAPRRLACIMEFIDGPTLKQVVRKKRLSVAQALNATLQMVSALRAVHAVNVIHRDLKPTNILLTGDLKTDLSAVPCVKVLDFGIAKVGDSPGEHKTASGTMLGTPAYMAPEQVAADQISPAADVYALGELLYEMMAGRRAFPGSRAEVLKTKMTGLVPALPLPQGIRASDQIRELVAKCVSHDPLERPTLQQFETEVIAIREFSVEDLGLEILDAEAPTDLHDLPTKPMLIDPYAPDAKTTIDLVAQAPRTDSGFDDPPPTVADSSASESPAIRPRRWSVLGAVVLSACAAIAVASMTGGKEKPNEPIAADAKPAESKRVPAPIAPPPKAPPPPVVAAPAPPPPQPIIRSKVRAKAKAPEKKKPKAAPEKPKSGVEMPEW
jgi:serine/threonine protein kinase